MAKISVIVPVYKVEKYINRCVNSILNQSFRDFDLVLIDDGSPDRCGAICDEYAQGDSRIYVIHQQNGGLSDARNSGIEWAFTHSDSEWITFIDSDDWIHEKYLEFLYRAAIENKAAVSMCWGYRTEGETIEPTNTVPIVRTPAEAYTRNYQCIRAVAWGRLYKKNLFETVRYPKGKLWEDLYTTHKVLFAIDKVAVIEDYLYYYYRNPESIIAGKWNPKKLDGIRVYREELIPYFRDIDEKMFQLVCKCYVEQITGMLRPAQDAGYQKEYKNLMQLLRKELMMNRVPIEGSIWSYEEAFPIEMRIREYCLAIIRRIKRTRRK